VTVAMMARRVWGRTRRKDAFSEAEGNDADAKNLGEAVAWRVVDCFIAHGPCSSSPVSGPGCWEGATPATCPLLPLLLLVIVLPLGLLHWEPPPPTQRCCCTARASW
jgi:hypothetical protein